jgi:hypothetical protein
VEGLDEAEGNPLVGALNPGTGGLATALRVGVVDETAPLLGPNKVGTCDTPEEAGAGFEGSG